MKVVMEVQDNDKFTRWYNQIIYPREYLTLPDGNKFDKSPYYKNEGFDSEALKNDLITLFKTNYE